MGNIAGERLVAICRCTGFRRTSSRLHCGESSRTRSGSDLCDGTPQQPAPALQRAFG